MKISADVFQSIMQQLRSDKPNEHDDKRREPRVGVRAQAFILPWSLDDSVARRIPITIRDLSRGGICIIAQTQISKGTQFSLSLQRPQGEGLTARYEVRYIKPLASHLWAVGAHLVNLLDESPTLTRVA